MRNTETVAANGHSSGSVLICHSLKPAATLPP